MIGISSGPATRSVAIVPADADLTASVRGLYIGSTGDVRVTTVDGDTVTFPSVPAAKYLPVQVRRVWATGTTASGIVGLF